MQILLKSFLSQVIARFLLSHGQGGHFQSLKFHEASLIDNHYLRALMLISVKACIVMCMHGLKISAESFALQCFHIITL